MTDQLILTPPCVEDEDGNCREVQPEPVPFFFFDHGDFISNYAAYADILEAPREMHEWMAAQTIAAALNRNGVTIKLGGLTWPMDFWLLFLSGSGMGRSTTTAMLRPLLLQAGPQVASLQKSESWGSPQAFYESLAGAVIDPASGLYTWGEFSERMKLFKDSAFKGALNWLTDRYDNPVPPDSITYRTAGQRPTPPIVFAGAPRLNITATSSEAWFFRNLAEDDSLGGFLPRWFIFRSKQPEKDVPIAASPDDKFVPAMAEFLRRLYELRGEADLSAIRESYDTWYRQTKKRFKNQVHREMAMAYFNRHRGHVLKLAVIFEVSSSLTLKVTQQSWDRAVAAARHAEDTIFELLNSTGFSQAGAEIAQFEAAIKDAGADGLRKNALTRRFQSTPSRRRVEILETLHDSDVISVFFGSTKGRPALVLVHRDFEAKFKAKHPQATEASKTKDMFSR